MASYISVPCPKFPSALRNGVPRVVEVVPQARVLLQGHRERKFHVLRAKAHEVTLEGFSNSLPLSTARSEIQLPKDKDVNVDDESTPQAAVSNSAISAFMLEVANLVKLVDSRDITELQLKQKDCELIIRKKEALQQPSHAAPVVMMHHPQGEFPTQPQVSHATPIPSSPPPAPALALPPAKGTKSSLPSMKCPMAGTFYRSSAPGEPPFVKVGDKVKKGQVVCIIEAMKLMNTIEADQSGTVIEILVEDGKPVSVDMPLLTIGP